MNLKNKVVIITGGNQGLGEALAYRLAKEGAYLILLARRENLLKLVKDRIVKSGGKADYFVCDVSDYKQVRRVIDQITKKHQFVDVLVNNAGIWFEGPTLTHPPEKVKELFMINSVGPINMVQAILPSMIKVGKGIILNVVSDSGIYPSGNWGIYVSTKFAAKGFTDSLREELKGTAIKILGFYQGGMNTNFFKKAGFSEPNQPWMMDPNNLANILIFMLTQPDDIDMQDVVVKKHMNS